MENQKKSCLIWGTAVTDKHLDPDKMNFFVEGSLRAGGDYEITDQVSSYVATLDEKDKAKLTTMLLDLRQQGQQRPVVTYDLVEKATVVKPLPDAERAERLLRYLVNKSTFVGELFVTYDIVKDHQALAWSKSIKEEEIVSFLEHMANLGWLKYKLERDCTVTVMGRQQIEEQARKTDLSQCFVAMWLDDSMKQVYDEGIEKAIIECGYTSMKIDEKQHLNKICDEAIAEIRRSRFVVADFTHGAAGARGSVYYEAGFAQALDLPVIFSCRKDQELHFDTRQYPHILWETPEDLYAQLKDKIGALIGDYKAEPASL